MNIAAETPTHFRSQTQLAITQYQFGYSQVGTASSIASSLHNYHLTRIYDKVAPYGSGKAIENLTFGYI